VSSGIKPLLTAAHSNEWLSVSQISVNGRNLTLRFEAAPKKGSRLKRAWDVSCRQVRDFCLIDFDGGGLNLWKRNHPVIQQFSSPKASLAINLGARGAEVLAVLLEAHRSAVDDWIEFDRFADFDRSSKTSARRLRIVAPQFLATAYHRRLTLAGFSAQLTKSKKQFYWSGRGWSKRRCRISMLHFGSSFIVADSFSAVWVDPVGRS
jgi:hypothetical protein